MSKLTHRELEQIAKRAWFDTPFGEARNSWRNAANAVAKAVRGEQSELTLQHGIPDEQEKMD